MFDLDISIPDGVFAPDFVAEERAKRSVLTRTRRNRHVFPGVVHGDKMPWKTRDGTCAMFGEGVILLQDIL